MASLLTLSHAENAAEFSRRIASGVTASLETSVGVNDGIRTTQELNQCLREGRNIQFDFSRLIDESKTYR